MKPNSGYTRKGFSKSGFGCCALWQFCQQGKTTCYYDKTDPEAKEYCQSYLRHHRQPAIIAQVEDKVSPIEVVEETLNLYSEEPVKEQKEEKRSEPLQLQLF